MADWLNTLMSGPALWVAVLSVGMWIGRVKSDRGTLKEIKDDIRRMDAKFDARFEQQDAKSDERFARMDAKMDAKFEQMDAKWEKRFARMDAKWDARFEQSDAKWDARLVRVEQGQARIEGRLEGLTEADAGRAAC